MTQRPDVASFYDDHTDKFLRDIVEVNERVRLQEAFILRSLSPLAGRILVVGCGVGQIVPTLLSAGSGGGRRIVGIDLSPRAIATARALHGAERARFVVCDILRDPIEGSFDCVVFPDSLEHIEKSSWHELAARVSMLLSDTGQVLITCPSIGHQDYLRSRNLDLQPVDEDISLADLVEFSRLVGGSVTYFAMVSAFRRNDYLHTVIEKDVWPVNPAQPVPRTSIKGEPDPLARLELRLRRSKAFRAIQRRILQSKMRRVHGGPAGVDESPGCHVAGTPKSGHEQV